MLLAKVPQGPYAAVSADMLTSHTRHGSPLNLHGDLVGINQQLHLRLKAMSECCL